MYQETMPDGQPKTLYVGNLDPSITEEFLMALFGQISPVKGCKLIHEPTADPYAFVEFNDTSGARSALLAMNKRQCMGRELKVNWATSPGYQARQDTSRHYHIFVGDLSPDIENHQLREAFAPFGEISDCKIVRESQSNKSKGYAFISFVRKEDAENAIQSMNGQWLGTKAIRTNWATRKPLAPYGSNVDTRVGHKPLSYDEVVSQASDTNTTVYCGGILNGITEELMQSVFGGFGAIENVRVFKDKGYAFIKFASKEAATNAIVAMHGADVNGYSAKCSWGKEANGPVPPSFAGASAASGSDTTAASSQAPQMYSQQSYMQQHYPMGGGGYWGYPQQPYMPPYGYPPYNYGNYGMPMGWPSGPVQQPYGTQGYPGQQ